MANLEEIVNDIEAWNKKSADGNIDVKEIDLLVSSYLVISHELLFKDPEFIVRMQRALGRAIIIYSYYKSPVYNKLIDFSVLDQEKCLDLVKGAFQVNKFDLLDKKIWYTNDFESTENKTSGTTGEPFKYKVWNDVFVPVEKYRHYGEILKEFNLTGPINVLYMVSGFNALNYNTIQHGKAKIKFLEGKDITNYVAKILVSHGSDQATVHHISFDEEAYFNIKDYCDFVVKYSKTHQIDVLLASGGFFELLCTHLITNESSEYPFLYKLLSNTGDRVNEDTLDFLVESGVANYWSDHMRCWDGGAGFFTCKENRYHLMEDLSFVYSDENEKMMSIDFFSYPSPFLNYANGDYCFIEEKWEQCKCGRWYRPFKFLSRRPRSNRTRSGMYYDTQKIHKYLTEKYKVKFVSYQDNLISIEDSTLNVETKEAIVRDMAKEHIGVHFFTHKNLRAFISMQKTTGGG